MIYLSGPMTGIPEFNAPAIRDAALRLRMDGYDILSPVEMDEAYGLNLKTAKITPKLRHNLLSRDIEAISTRCTAIALMPGWKQSAGCMIELAVAERLGLKVYTIDENYKLIPYRESASGFRIELRVL
jgi:hypothetical protein